MSWALAIAAYLVVAGLVWSFGADLVGDCSTGRKALPLVSLLWPLALWLLVLVGVVAAFDALVSRQLDQTFGSGDDE